jgi:hypothetical protein
MSGLAPLISEMLGIEKMSIEYTGEGRRHRVKIGEAVEMEVGDVVSAFDPDGPAPKLTGVHHPANATLTVARGVESRIAAFGYEIALRGTSGFSAPFSWAG